MITSEKCWSGRAGQGRNGGSGSGENGANHRRACGEDGDGGVGGGGEEEEEDGRTGGDRRRAWAAGGGSKSGWRALSKTLSHFPSHSVSLFFSPVSRKLYGSPSDDRPLYIL